jgi:uncharacterized protein (UPF0262 family)
MANKESIKALNLDDSIAHFRSNLDLNTSIKDLLSFNYFSVVEKPKGPYTVVLSLEDNRLNFQINKKHKVQLPLRSFRSLIKDYFLILDSHQDALKHGMLEKIEAIDMGRRSLHNEGAELIIELLENKINTDFETARRLFTIITILHIK